MAQNIVGIDLGTTNSEIAAFIDGSPQVIGNGSRLMLPSCVGLSPAGDLLIGEPARNQMLLYPERTVRSVKRLMGTGEKISLGDKTFNPPEISALILRELARWASARLRETVKEAVITVPAYFSDAQRNATREAGELAGLQVVRIVNEPTAASLAYGLDAGGAPQTVMIYDLGGGTLDVSIVRIEGEITEVLASHGNNHLGGDDFDQKLVEHLLDLFRIEHSIDLRDQHPGAAARLWWAAEAAKKQLSFEPFARIREEALVQVDGRPLHFDVEVTREQYEGLIRPLLETTLDSASKALTDAGLLPQALDAVLLVGGSTRTPLVVSMLEKMCGKPPRQDLHPDLCVALGAGVLASRMSGHAVEKVLVDVSPFSFGPGYLGVRDGLPDPNCYHPVIKRNTPLPVTRTEVYTTSHDYQNGVDIDIYQGDDPDARKNVHVGHFKVDGLKPVEGPNPVLCRMRLDLDGILHVTAIEKNTGLSKHVAISGATRRRNSDELAKSREELDKLFKTQVAEDNQRVVEAEPPVEEEVIDPFVGTIHPGGVMAVGPAVAESPAPAAASTGTAQSAAKAAVEKTRQLMATLHGDDQEEALGLIENVEDALAANDPEALAAAAHALSEFLFFVEGK
jgi:molecular chaperone DnaK (HSP70)